MAEPWPDEPLPRVRVRWTGVRRMDASDPLLQKLEASNSASHIGNVLRTASSGGPNSFNTGSARTTTSTLAVNKLFFMEREYSNTPYVVRVVNNCVAFLHRGTHVIERSFVFPDRVRDAVMTHFETASPRTASDGIGLPATPLHTHGANSSTHKARVKKRGCGKGLELYPEPYLCVLVRSDCVNIYTPSGEVYEAALPFQANRLFAMESGLLMQRSPAAHPSSSSSSQLSQKSNDTPNNSSLYIDKELASRPRFFTLAHPLDEVKPVALAPEEGGASKLSSRARSTQSRVPTAQSTFLCDPALEIVAFSTARSLLVCFHSQDRQFCVYELQAFPADRSQRVTPVKVVDSATWQKHRERESDHDEDDKVAIVPDWMAVAVWTSPAMERSSSMSRVPPSSTYDPSSKAAFLATDLDLAPLLCMMDKQSGVLILKRVNGFSSPPPSNNMGADPKNAEDLKTIRCRDALPISTDSKSSDRTSDAPTDIVILQDDRKLLLNRGEYQICEIIPPSADNSSVKSSWPPTTEIRINNDASCFEVCGHELAESPDLVNRCEHPLHVGFSPLLERAFTVLQNLLPATIFLSLKAEVATQHQQNQAEKNKVFESAIYTKNDSNNTNANGWEVFCDITTTLLDKESRSRESHGTGSEMEMVAAFQATTETAFDKLLRSSFHQAYQAENAMLFMQMDTSSVQASLKVPTPSNSQVACTTRKFSALQPYMMEIFAGLHLLYEDLKLSVTSSQFRQQLADLLLKVSALLGLEAYSAYYRHETGNTPRSTVTSASSTATSKSTLFPGWENTSVPDIVGWIHMKIRISSHPSSAEVPFPMLPSGSTLSEVVESREPGLSTPLWRTIAVCHIYELLTPTQVPGALANKETNEQDHLERENGTALMVFLTQNPFGVRLSIQDLPFGIQFPIVEAISNFRHAPPPFITEDICHFIGREDLAGVISSRVSNFQSSEHARGQHGNNAMKESAELYQQNENQQSHEASDGLEEIMQRSQPLFPCDQRMKEVARLIRSNRPLCLKLGKTSDTSDQDYVLQQQARLLLLCKRSMSLPIARGMVTLGSFDMNMAQNHAWQLRVPELPLAGRTPPTNAIVQLDVSGYAKELTFWPQFHNGCAAGLRLPARDLSNVVNRYWIKYHRPSVAEHQARAAGRNNPQAPSPEATKRSLEEAYAAHAGLLLGLGLRGHLKCLSMADVYNYLSLSNEFVTVAILLGMATTAAHCRHRRKTQSKEFKKTGSSRNSVGSSPGTSSPESSGDPGLADVALEDDGFLSGSTSKAPLVGSGLELTLERSVSKMLCLHIPSLLPPPFAEFSVPASTQTAALLGLGILYQATGHRLMTELLLTEIARSPSSAQFVSSNSNSGLSTASFDQLEGYALAAGLALGLVVLGRGQAKSGDPGLADMKLEEKLYKYIVGGAQQFGDANAAGGCLYRGRKWNTFGTSSNLSGASGTSNGSSNGSSDSGRESKSHQDRGLRGEHVNIGVTACGSALALAFIYMQTENKSIAAQLAVPDTLILLDYIRPDILLVRTLAKNLVMWDSIIPTSEWIEDSQVPMQLMNAYKALQSDSHAVDRDQDMFASSSVHSDAQSICEAYANVIAGACFSIGFRFAGTGDDSARKTLRKYLVHFRDMRSKVTSGMMAGRGNVIAAATERVTIMRCLAVCAQALALVDAGTGNIETLTLLRSINLRQRVDSELTYGNHMALSTAIGLLFIGGGRATVSRSKEAIAALVISLFPMYPMNTADNKYHLQAFRHLYVLAVDTSRLLETIDVNSGANCSVPVRLELRRLGLRTSEAKATSKWQTLQSPCLLPDLSSIKRILISSNEYYPVEILMSSKRKAKSEKSAMDQQPAVTANALRLELLRSRNMILLKRTKQNSGRAEGLSGTSDVLSALLSHASNDRHVNDKDDQLVAAYESYFLLHKSPDHPDQRFQGSSDCIVASNSYAKWWRTHCQQLLVHQVREEASSFLPVYLNVLHALFRLQHLPFQPSSLAGLRNLKLCIDYCEGESRKRHARRESNPSFGGDRSHSTKDDFVVWLKHQTEEALTVLWEKCAIPITTLSDAQAQVFKARAESGGEGIRNGAEEEEAQFVMKALVNYFAAPTTRMAKSPETWKTVFQQQVAPSVDHGQQQLFKLGEFLLTQQQRQGDVNQVTQDEKTFWLQLVSFFLFGV